MHLPQTRRIILALIGWLDGEDLMIERIDTLAEKLRFIFVGVFAIAFGILLLGVLLTGFQAANAASVEQSSFLESPNVIAGGMATAGQRLGTAMSSAGETASKSLHTTTSIATTGGHTISHGALVGVGFIARGTGNILSFMAGTIVNTVSFIIRIPSNVFNSISNTRVVSSVIKPADHNPVPIIDPNSSALAAAKQALPATTNAVATSTNAPANPAVRWPLHGIITTEFGVPELPYQAIHTGLDITDQRPSGVTPIYAFRQGRVIATEHRGGLGNHVVVDHGNGVTSVYGHLASITVSVGQEVDTNSALGLEGTTGVSTGVHLHFEIRVNGQAANPHQFITGNP